jgi:hypothetical protein
MVYEVTTKSGEKRWTLRLRVGENTSSYRRATRYPIRAPPK